MGDYGGDNIKEAKNLKVKTKNGVSHPQAPQDARRRECDLIFVDPPYSDTRETTEGSALGKLLILLGEAVATGGIVVVRTNRRTELLEEYGRLETIERRQWGTMAVTILRKLKT